MERRRERDEGKEGLREGYTKIRKKREGEMCITLSRCSVKIIVQ